MIVEGNGGFEEGLALIFGRGAEQGEIGLVIDGDDLGRREAGAVRGFEFQIGGIGDEFGGGEHALRADDGGEGAALARRVFFPWLPWIP